jgi:peptidoglycan/xylan/chitin deacetylase (PgdA/CDA1 family)
MDTKFACLMYHNIEDDASNRYSVPYHAFRDQVVSLLDMGFVLEGFRGLEARMASGNWPDRYGLVTFDDGHRSFLTAAETLASFGIKGTFFLTRDYCLQRQAFLKENEIRELASMADVGTHGVNHRGLTRMSHELARNQLRDSKSWLEQCSGRTITYMSAPGGFWDETLQALALVAGYTLVGTSREWWNRPVSSKSNGLVARVAVRASFTVGQVHGAMTCQRSFYLRRYARNKLIYLPRLFIITLRKPR